MVSLFVLVVSFVVIRGLGGRGVERLPSRRAAVAHGRKLLRPLAPGLTLSLRQTSFAKRVLWPMCRSAFPTIPPVQTAS